MLLAPSPALRLTTSASSKLWTTDEEEILAPREELPVSAWSDRYRELHGPATIRLGMWDTAFTPYTREPMDAASERKVRRIILKWATQVAKTEVQLNILGHAADTDPCPMLHVLPIETEVNEFYTFRIVEGLFKTPRLRRHLSGAYSDESGNKIRLIEERCLIRFVHAVPTRLGSWPVQRVFIDEVDKIIWRGNQEAHPVDLAIERTKNFPTNSLVVLACTPTREEGRIHTEFEAGDQRRYYVPCHQCGYLQTLQWKNVFYPQDIDASGIETNYLARYKCPACEAFWTEGQKRQSLQYGTWLPAGHEPTAEYIDRPAVDEEVTQLAHEQAAGEGIRHEDLLPGDHLRIRQAVIDQHYRGPCPWTSHVSYTLSTLYSPIVGLSDCAAEFIRCKKNRGRLQNFINSWLSEVWKETLREATAESLKARAAGEVPKGIVPQDALGLVAGIDVQEGHFWMLIAAWGYEGKLWIVRADRIETWAALEKAIFIDTYPRDGRPDEQLQVEYGFIDSAYLPDQVYSFCDQHPETILPIYGSERLTGAHLIERPRRVDQQGKFLEGHVKWVWDKQYFSGRAVRLVSPKDAETCDITLYQHPEDHLLDQLVSWHLTPKRQGKTNTYLRIFEPKRSGIADHLFLCLCYVLCMGQYLDCDYQLPDATPAQAATQDHQTRQAIQNAHQEDYTSWTASANLHDWSTRL